MRQRDKDLKHKKYEDQHEKEQMSDRNSVRREQKKL